MRRGHAPMYQKATGQAIGIVRPVAIRSSFPAALLPPAISTTLKQEKLADTLAHIADAGLDDFYRGDVGREIAVDLERLGKGPLG